VSYSPTEWRTFEPVARVAELQARTYPDRRDLFLCHAWDDRQGAAKDLYDQLLASGATVWFSETEVGLGKSLLREIDRGLAMSRIGIVLVPRRYSRAWRRRESPTRNSLRCSSLTG
jgi:TIR domain